MDTVKMPGRVIALHCSGADAGQWRSLGETLGPVYALTAPEHYGCERTGPWRGAGPFSLADEAARTIALIDAGGGRVHLVGHSYGGGVALKAALARPGRIASIALYEPSAFHLLKSMGQHGAAAFEEIAALAYEVGACVSRGDHGRAAAAFVDYWGGAGAWQALRPSVRDALVRWMPKAPLDFHALMFEPAPPAAYTVLPVPVLLMRGEHAPRPTRLIADMLATRLPNARLAVLDGAGHMGPITHASTVNALIAEHLERADVSGAAGDRAWLDIGPRPLLPPPPAADEAEAFQVLRWRALLELNLGFQTRGAAGKDS